MKRLDVVRRMAQASGIEPHFVDAFGRHVQTTDATCERILAAMRLPVDSTQADLQHLETSLQCQPWRRRMPPVCVSWADAAPTAVELVLPAGARGTWQWQLQFESGDARSGDFRPSDLTPIEERMVDGERRVRVSFLLPPTCPPGYHHLQILAPAEAPTPALAMPLIVAPATCYLPPQLQREARLWGPAVQLYGLRSRHNWGIGDFTDLHSLVDVAVSSGAAFVGLNPLHALFAQAPERRSPYSPSSRRFLNVLYIDVEAVPDVQESPRARACLADATFQARLRRLRAAEQVDADGVTAAKMEVLSLAHAHFVEHHLAHDTRRARSFQRYCAQGGAALEEHARFEALFAHLRAADRSMWGWPVWPQEYRSPASPAVAAFAADHARPIDLHRYLQWQADLQLHNAAWRASQAGLAIGLYRDMALGVDPGGSDAWHYQELLAHGASAGAPPDPDNPLGQDWGLPPMIPNRLRESAYRPFIALLQANMQMGGALRLDHVMSLMRLFWVPEHTPAAQGAYVRYPFDDLLGILALESQRNRCLVVGEDLGTVPQGLREALSRRRVLSYRLLLFERNEQGGLKRPAQYPRQALAAAATHDLPTLAGFWLGRDLDERQQLGLFPSQDRYDSSLVERARDRTWLLIALRNEGLLPPGVPLQAVAVPVLTPALAQAVHAWLARTPTMLMAVQAEDIFGVVEQANVPTSTDQRPNWCNKLPLDLEDWTADSRFADLVAILRHERGSHAWTQGRMGEAPRQAVIPRATYRLQLNRDFTLEQATDLVPYLAQLGISHCYASPYLKARPGSRHGYDIVNHNALNPEIGTFDDLQRFVETLERHGMGHILDVVPNHMGVMGADNEWWLDVLENGQCSRFADFFDIDWHPLNAELHGKVLLPLLGDQYGAVLVRGELKLVFDERCGEFYIHYYQHRLPLDPAEYPRVIAHQFERLAATLGAGATALLELQSLITALRHLPPRNETGREPRAERARDKQLHKRQLSALCAAAPDIARHLATNVAEFNGTVEDADSFDELHELIKAQAWRLAFWRVASDEINYRRFFDINDLAALRMENLPVFEATHGLVLSLIERGWLHGLRIDHADGLYDPGEYFRRLQAYAGMRESAPLPVYVIIEKILAEHEQLPSDWPIHGETGYRFANLVNGLWVDTGAEKRITRVYAQFTGTHAHFDELAYESKRLIMRGSLQSELNVLANHLSAIAAASRFTCDFTLNSLRAALAQIIASFPVYRTYRSEGRLSETDRRHIHWAVEVGRRHSSAADTSAFDFVRDVLTGDIAEHKGAAYQHAVDCLAMEFQQYTSPVTAKGVEDTAFYRYNRLVSLNDVGADPTRFGISVAAFHAFNKIRCEQWPHSMLAGSTHDSKRSEDVRARIDVLSEIPAGWRLVLRQWSRLNRSKRHVVDGRPAPSPNDEYLLYQTLFGTWPLHAPTEGELAEYAERIGAYMQKAAREAKENTSWLNVNTEYEQALAAFVNAVLAGGEKNRFLADFVPVTRRFAPLGLVNALAQTLLKLTCPGVPDIYQGCELWQPHLVDPDNRRPVDYALRRRLLAEVCALRTGPPSEWADALRPLTQNMADGRIKLYLTSVLLQSRRRWPQLFAHGDYLPLPTHGTHAAHVCAYARRHGRHFAVGVVPRLLARLRRRSAALDPDRPWTGVWGDTRVSIPAECAAASGFNVLTGETAGGSELSVETLLAHFPVALLAYAPGEGPAD